MRRFLQCFIGLLTLAPFTLAADTATESSSEPLSYLALGDSYTIGQSVRRSARWPVLLQQDLAKENIILNTPNIIARTGWTTKNLLAAIRAKKPQPNYDLVTLMIGVNDQYQGQSIDKFSLHLEELIRISISLANNQPKRVLLVSIPDWGYSPFAKFNEQKSISEEIDQFNLELQRLAKKHQLQLANVTPISRIIKREDFAIDGLHPSKQQYQRWVDAAILPAIKAMLNN